MKTTVEISDSLFEKTRRFAANRGSTFREVFEAALSLFLKGEERTKPFKLKNCSFKGNGLVEGLDWGDWDEIRRRAYEGHGG